jgi:serine/threonine protein phosphatase PrpC
VVIGASGPATWCTLAGSHVGANHVRVEMPNQDAYAVRPELAGAADPSDTVVLAVADGHGSAAHPRSAAGAEIATEKLVDLAMSFSAACARNEPLRTLKSAAEEQIPRELVRKWREGVRAHATAAANPLGTRDDDEVFLAYGSTLLGAVITPRLLVCWQLGDGELAIVEGANVSFPLAPAERQLGVETDSLCQPDAWSRVRVHWQPLHGACPDLVLLATDGLVNSYADHAGFEAFGVGMLERIRSAGVAAVRDQLDGWLAKAAEFSGDDATLAAAWRSPGDGAEEGAEGA